MQSTEQSSRPHPRSLSLSPRDATCLLETFMRRTQSDRCQKKEIASLGQKRNPSDTRAQQPATAESHRPRKANKPSLLKRFLGLFSRRGKAGHGLSVDSPPNMKHKEQDSYKTGKRTRRESPLRRFSLSSQRGSKARFQPVNAHTAPPTEVTAGLKRTYYERVSEEVDKIVREVEEIPARAGSTESSEDDIINMIISLLKEQGDSIEEKLQESKLSGSPHVTPLSYDSFQQQADLYVQRKASLSSAATANAPELVRLAFTLNFTSKLAEGSQHTAGRILGFGNQYLQERFTH